MQTIKAKVTITPAPRTERREIPFVSPAMALSLADDPAELLDGLIDAGVLDGEDEVAIQLGYLQPGAVWRKCTGSYRYQVVDMQRVWRYTAAPSQGPVFSFGLDGSPQLNDEELVVVVRVSQLPNWHLLAQQIRWMTEDK